MIKLSIIIPHYNSVKLLERLLIKIPDIPVIQVIVVDDRSTEYVEELKILEQSVSCKNIEFYINKSLEKGAGVARNIGLSHAEGEWVLFADADDCFVDGFYNIVQSYFDIDADIVFFAPTSRDLTTGNSSYRHIFYEQLVHNYLINPTKETEVKLKYFYHSPCSKLIRRSLIQEHNIAFDNTLVANDVMCSIKCSYYCNQFIASDQVIYCISVHDEGLTRNLTEQKFGIRFKVELDKYIFLKQILPKEEFVILDFNMIQYILMLREHHLGLIQKYIQIVKQLIKYKVPVMEKRLRNPIYVSKKVFAKLGFRNK